MPSIFDTSNHNIDVLIKTIDADYDKILIKNIDNLDYLRVMNQVVLERYHHDFFVYEFSENFVLYLFCLLTNPKHLGIVYPNHLAQGNSGICSQQAILCMELATTMQPKNHRKMDFRFPKSKDQYYLICLQCPLQ